MHSFTYVRATQRELALAACGPGAMYLAGGTDLLQLLKSGAAAPDRVVDLAHLRDFDGIERQPHGGVTIAALAKMADVARSRIVAEAWPLVSQALLLSASPQVRNVATMGGNLLQRTRCPYFRDATLACNKRVPGSGCPARNGDHRNLAIFGASDHCMATHASDLAVALVAARALVHVEGPGGTRRLPIEELYVRPGDHPERDV